MDSRGLWRAVGKALTDLRIKRGWATVHAMYKATENPPHFDILKNNEAGDIKTTAALDAHLAILGASLVDILRSILSEGKVNPTCAEMKRLFCELNEGAQDHVLDLVKMLPKRPAAPPASGPEISHERRQAKR